MSSVPPIPVELWNQIPSAPQVFIEVNGKELSVDDKIKEHLKGAAYADFARHRPQFNARKGKVETEPSRL
jgi:hypothetical protein